ncbi:MAG TPA: hypothetical protein VIM73_14400, partial [Polyangiaceae bacterium]
LVDGMLERLESELEYSSRVIATGGLAGLIRKHSRRIDEVDANLTLDGLRILHERNAQVAPAQRGATKKQRVRDAS